MPPCQVRTNSDRSAIFVLKQGARRARIGQVEQLDGETARRFEHVTVGVERANVDHHAVVARLTVKIRATRTADDFDAVHREKIVHRDVLKHRPIVHPPTQIGNLRVARGEFAIAGSQPVLQVHGLLLQFRHHRSIVETARIGCGEQQASAEPAPRGLQPPSSRMLECQPFELHHAFPISANRAIGKRAVAPRVPADDSAQ
jgi:hypothetical protein